MMADATPPPPGAPGQPERRRPAPTIDLKATEIASAPAAATAGGSAQTPPQAPLPEPPDDEAAAEIPPKSAVHQTISRLAAAVSWRLVGAGVAGVLLTLGIAWAVLMVSAGQGDPGAAEARLAQLERQVADLAGHAPAAAASASDVASRLQQLEAQVGRLAAAPRPVPDPALPDRIAALEAQLKSLNDTLSSVGQRSESTAAANAAALSDLAQKLARADKSEARSSEASDAAASQSAAALAALANRVDALEGGTKTLERSVASTLATEQAQRDAETSDEHAVRTAIIAAALAAAVERGDTFEAEFKAAQAQAPDAAGLAPLAGFAAAGLPSADALARELASLEPSLIRAAAEVPPESGFLQKLQAHAERLVRIRPVEEAAGDDPATILARAQIKAGRGDVPGALTELGTLPATVRAPAQAWIDQAQARTAAIAASRAFAAETLAALAMPSR
jgi:hypothetical protein